MPKPSFWTPFVTMTFLALACSRNEPSSGGDKSNGASSATATIKIGQTMPYSGPASAYGTIGKLQTAYFKKINQSGGINGKKIEFLTVDDGYSPPKTVEQVRKLVEQYVMEPKAYDDEIVLRRAK